MFLDINSSVFVLIIVLFLVIVLFASGLAIGLIHILKIKVIRNRILKYWLLFFIILIIVYILLGLLYKITGKGLLEY